MLDGDKERDAFAALIEAAIAIGPDVLVVAGDLSTMAGCPTT